MQSNVYNLHTINLIVNTFQLHFGQIEKHKKWNKKSSTDKCVCVCDGIGIY